MTNNHEKMTALRDDEVRSWTVIRSKGRPELIPTKWQPGYTPAHTETREQAIAYALKVREEQILGLQLEMSIIAVLAMESAAKGVIGEDVDPPEVPNDESGLELEEESEEEFRARLIATGQEGELTKFERQSLGEALAKNSRQLGHKQPMTNGDIGHVCSRDDLQAGL